MKPTASSTVDHGYENRLGQTKGYDIDIDFSALSTRQWEVRANTGWLGIMITCWVETTCGLLFQWDSAKQQKQNIQLSSLVKANVLILSTNVICSIFSRLCSVL